MYKKAMTALVGVYLFLLAGVLAAMEMKSAKAVTCIETLSMKEQIGIANYSSSERRTVDVLLMQKEAEEEMLFPPSEIEVLQRIVEAEAGGEDADGKLLVANVVLNRVQSEDFPNTISEVVFQRSGKVTQFSPVANGRYDEVVVSEESKEAAMRALAGEDLSQGALYFASRKYADKKNMRWFDENLTRLFQHGGHEFFK